MVQILIMVIRIYLINKDIILLRNILKGLKVYSYGKNMNVKYGGGYFTITNNHLHPYYGSLRNHLKNLV